MQTTINKNMAVGIPGTHGNGQPYFADPYIAGADVTMGNVAAIAADGTAVPYASGKTPVGIFVNPNEHIRMVLPSDERSLVVKKGATVAVAKKGSWYVKVPADATEAAKWVKGATLAYSNSTYYFAQSANNVVAEIVSVGSSQVPFGTGSTPDKGAVALIRFK